MKVWGIVLGLVLGGCVAPERDPFLDENPDAELDAEIEELARDPVPPPPVWPQRPQRGDSIVVNGKLVHVGAPVVLWDEPPRYNAYETGPIASKNGARERRYRRGRKTDDDPDLATSVRARGWDDENLRRRVDQFVVHYDTCGTSEVCFRVLHHQRGLSVHFLLDVDGTIYQTLDLREEAWHARQANRRSIGVEIAQVGAYPPGDSAQLDAWYDERPGETRLIVPVERRSGVRTAGFQGRTARPRKQVGTIHGALYEQYDFTPEQYASLAKLAAALSQAFPRIELDAPRDRSGRVRTDMLDEEEFAAFSGVLGHHHVTDAKHDPGPAFDWERFLREARAAALAP